MYELTKDVELIKHRLHSVQKSYVPSLPVDAGDEVARTKRNVASNNRKAGRKAENRKQLEKKRIDRRTQRENRKIRSALSSIGDGIHMHSRHKPSQNQKEQRHTCGYLSDNTLRVNCKIFDIWVADPHFGNSSTVKLINGMLYVEKPGTYYVYAQLTYHDLLGSWSSGIMLRRGNLEKDVLLSQCIGMESFIQYSNYTQKYYPNLYQCQTSRVVRLKAEDKLYVSDLYYQYANRELRVDEPLTFWGVVNLGTDELH